jgi:hypothetical protein
LRRQAALLFLALWLAYGAGINKLNLQAYTLHPVVVKALAEQGTFVIGHEAQPKQNDRFLFEGNVLPAKQPLIFAAGAVAYVPCRWLGVTYERDYFLAGAVVTWLTASLLAAAAAAAASVLAVTIWGFRRREALAAVVLGAAGTMLLPYAGIPHHDIAAMGMLLIGILSFESARRQAATGAPHGSVVVRAALAGLLLGLALGFSMLPAAIVLGVLIAVAWTRRPALIVAAAFGFAAGLAPLALYDLHYFHSPFVQANLAGGYDDTYPGFAPDRVVHHLNAYLGLGEVSLWKYAPIVVAGAAGVALLAWRRRAPGRFLGALLLLHFLYVLSIPAIGYCQYGPRFLIPAIPLAALGLAPVFEEVRLARRAAIRFGAGAAVALLALWSIAVNLAGTLGGTMYCTIEEFAFPRYLAVLGLDLDRHAVPAGPLLPAGPRGAGGRDAGRAGAHRLPRLHLDPSGTRR